MFHGNAGNLSTAVHRLMGYADLGFDVFMVDYHGFGKSGGFPSEANLYAAADALWDHVVENGNVPPKAIVILGYSLGGAVASYLAEKHPDTAGLILESTFTSLAEVAADFFPYLPCGLIVGNAYDTADRLHAIHMPLLVIHGPGDELVAYTHGKALYDAFTGRKEFLEINDDHNLGFLLSGDSYYQGIAQFMEKVVERTD